MLSKIPEKKRGGRRHRGPRALLSWMMRRFHYRRRSKFRLRQNDPENARIMALLSLLRAASSHAETILGASRRGVAEAGYANLRAMLELWADFRLAARDPSGANVRRMQVAAGLALLRRSPNSDHEAELASTFPDVFAECKRQFTKAPYKHWTGKGRKEVVGIQCGSQYEVIYEMLSWDSHPIVQTLLDLTSLDGNQSEFSVAHRNSQFDVSQVTCVTSAHIIFDMWNEFVEVAGDSVRTA